MSKSKFKIAGLIEHTKPKLTKKQQQLILKYGHFTKEIPPWAK